MRGVWGAIAVLMLGLAVWAPDLAAGQKPAASAASKAAVVNLNTATVADLRELPGIGEKTAARIVEYRQKRGPFKKIEDLMNVQGIGEKAFLKLKPQITVAGKAEASGQPE